MRLPAASRLPGSHRGMTFQVPLLQVNVASPWAGSYKALVHSRVRFSPCGTSTPGFTLLAWPYSMVGTTQEAKDSRETKETKTQVKRSKVSRDPALCLT